MNNNSEIHFEDKIDFEEFNSRIKYALSHFEKPQLAKKRLRFYRWKTVEELDKNILEFENATKRTGGNILWGNDIEDSVNTIKSILETNNNKSAFISSKTSSEIDLGNTIKIDSLEEFHKKNKNQVPDLVIAQAKFLVSNSGHIYYCTANRNEFDAVSNAKVLIFVAGIESIVNNGVELELAKNLFSTYELGQFGYPMEILLKSGKPENRFTQHVHLLIVDHGRSNLLENSLNRRFFPLLNFEIPHAIAEIFWKQSKNNPDITYPFQHFLTDTLRNSGNHSKNFLFANNAYNRLSAFLPFEMDVYDYFIQSRLHYTGSIKSNLLKRITKKNYVKAFMQPKSKMPTKKFVAFLRGTIMNNDFNPKNLPEKTFIEQYYYDKRKI
ncbi:MAG: LUD domain-containing protein [Bacteroidia bacterium]|nr:LUD domain-containing protein [Bacteroidia bacterium]